MLRAEASNQENFPLLRFNLAIAVMTIGVLAAAHFKTYEHHYPRKQIWFDHDELQLLKESKSTKFCKCIGINIPDELRNRRFISQVQIYQ